MRTPRGTDMPGPVSAPPAPRGARGRGQDGRSRGRPQPIQRKTAMRFESFLRRFRPNPMRRPARPSRGRPGFEQLEGRSLPTISFVGGVLTVTGTPGDDTITVARLDAATLFVDINTIETASFAVAEVTKVLVDADAGADTV